MDKDHKQTIARVAELVKRERELQQDRKDIPTLKKEVENYLSSMQETEAQDKKQNV